MVVPLGHSQLPLVELRVGLTVPLGAMMMVVHWQIRLEDALLYILLNGHSHSRDSWFQTRESSSELRCWRITLTDPRSCVIVLANLGHSVGGLIASGQLQALVDGVYTANC
jgi:hypothetical protein